MINKKFIKKNKIQKKPQIKKQKSKKPVY